ncbi:MAG: hypothetical protein OEY14_12565, partial [Myxococcales bacterium]|nr:hypothetical protein [Myxococcales bacterium]
MRRASSRPERRSHRLASAKAAARVGAALLGGLLLLGSPLLGSSARADAIESLHLSLDAEALRVTIRSSDPLPEPRIRTGRGRVRLWFPGLEHQPRLERRGDAQVLRWVKARPGDEGTGVVILRLADARRIPLDGIQLSRDGTGTVLRIARSLLPGAPPAAEPEGLAGALPEAQGASQPSAGAVGETGLDTLSAGETGLDAPGLQEVSPSEAGEAGSEAAPEAPEAAAAAGDAEATEEADALEDPREAASPEPVSTRPDVERAAGSAPLAAGLN